MKIYPPLPKKVKPFAVDVYMNCLGVLKKIQAEKWPQKHAEGEMKRQSQVNLDRVISLSHPVYFIEKLEWLKYFVYNKSPLVAKCFNKHEVRSYVERKGLGKILNEQYYVCNKLDDIPWDNLPDECVIKVSNGYYGHVFKKKSVSFDVIKAKKQLADSHKRSKYAFKISGDLFAYGTKSVFVCERLIKAKKSGALPDDFKFYCFHGEPLFLEYICDRDYDNKEAFFKSAFIDIVNMNDRTDLEARTSPIKKIELPESYGEMLQYARILSEDFPFVRVDFYEENGHPIFGELTFTPGHVETKNSMKELGKYLRLEEIDRYLDKLL